MRERAGGFESVWVSVEACGWVRVGAERWGECGSVRVGAGKCG